MSSLYFDQGPFFHLLFMRVDCECNRPSCLVTVFDRAYVFNGDLNQWDVAKVTSMYQSKSICILENDLRDVISCCRVIYGVPVEVCGWW